MSQDSVEVTVERHGSVALADADLLYEQRLKLWHSDLWDTYNDIHTNWFRTGVCNLNIVDIESTSSANIM